MICNPAGLFILLLAWNIPTLDAGFREDSETIGPSFTKEPPAKVILANTVGTNIDCSANGNPTPTISWVMLDKIPISDISHIRITRPNGTLVISPFRSEQFRPDVHAAAYRCLAINPVGTIISREVHVQGVVVQPYDAQVYDTYAMEKNTAILKCHIPDVVKNYVSVTAWIKNDNLLIQSSGYEVGDKYAIMSTGELHIREVTTEDGGSTYKCKTLHHLTGESVISKLSGRLYVTESHGSISPSIVDSLPFVTTSVNEKVILPCVGQGFPVPRMTWYKKNGSSIDKTINSKDDHFLLSQSGLIIVNARMSDAATYRCEIANELGKEHRDVTLNVIGPIGVVVHPQRYVAKIGDSINITCSVSGNSVTSVSWLHNGMDVPKRVQNLSEDVFQIKNIQASDRGMYQCVVKSGDGRVIHATIELKLSEIAPQLIDAFEEVSLQPGSTISLTCVALGIPTPTVFWKMDGIPLESGPRIHITNEQQGDGRVKSQLIVDNMVTKDGGIYTCLAKNKQGTAEHMSRINVYGSLHSREIPKMLAVSGTTAYLNCPVYGYPIEKITWKKDKRMLPSNLQQHVFYNGTLRINNMEKPLDEGMYICTASNTADGNVERVESSVDVQIIVAPKIIPFEFQDDLLREGMRARLQCVVSQGDLPLTITWLKDGKPIPPELGVLVNVLDDFSSILTIGGIKPGHNGKYTCVASNRAATDKYTAELSVNVPPKIIPFAFLDDQFYKGMRAHVTCAISRGDLPVTFTWLKDDRPIPSDVEVVIRKYDDHTDSLSIENVGSRHSGNYTCVARNSAGTAIHTSQLLVRVAPKIVPFHFRDLPYEGSTARMVCGLQEGDMPIRFFWLYNGTPVRIAATNPIHIHETEGISSILSISNLTARHTGTYTCTAENKAGVARHDFVLLVHVPPKIVPFSFKEDHLVKGLLARVSCVVSRGDLPLELRWEKDGMPIASGSEAFPGVQIKSFDEHSSILSIANISQQHNGLYTCIANNHAGSARHSVQLTITVPPRWVIEPQNIAALKGENVMIHCVAEGHPKPTITWVQTKDLESESGLLKPIQDTVNMRIFLNGTLLLKTIDTTNSGYYFCKASNGIGKGLSTVIKVKINAPPQFKKEFEKLNAAAGQDFQLQCLSEGDLPMNVTWFKDRKSLESGHKRFRIETTNTTSEVLSILVIHKVKRSDNGDYKCKVQNKYGENKTRMHLTVLEIPDPPKNIKSTAVGGRTIELSWEAAFNGNLHIKKYMIQYINAAGNWNNAIVMEMKNGDVASAIITQLQPATKYRFRVFAENNMGRSNSSEIIEVTTNEELPSGPPLSIQVETVNMDTFKINFKPPEERLWNGKIQGYYIGYKEVESHGSYHFKTLLTPEPHNAELLVEISGLRHFTKYAIVVQAYNGRGRGPESEPVMAMTSEGAPRLPPTAPRCTTLTSQSIHVTWEAPPQDSINGILRGYKVMYKPATEWYDDVAESFVITPTTSETLSSLDKFTNYTVKVHARTKAGDGPSSETIFCKTLDDVPDPPMDIKVIAAADNAAVVVWKPPEHANGVIKSYNVYWKPLTDNKATDSHTVSADDHSHEVTRLKKDQHYEFWVTASTMAGEGKSTRRVSQYLQGPEVPAKIIAFDNKIIIPWKTNVTLPCQAVGFPRPDRQWTTGGKSIMDEEFKTVLADGSLSIKSVQEKDSGDYTCYVHNTAGEDKVAYTIAVLGPPLPPMLKVVSTTPYSIEIEWNISGTNINVKGFNLYLRRHAAEWSEINLGGRTRTHQLTQLECGARYEIYLTAFNKIGVGAPSETITVFTNGSVPTAPEKHELIEEMSTSVSLYLNSWKSDVCPIQYYTVEYAKKLSSDWIFVSNNVKPEQRRLVIPGLGPATWYSLRMTAHNSAGLVAAEYTFATLTMNGATIPPDLGSETGMNYMMIFLSAWVILPVSITVVILITILAVACIYVRSKTQPPKRRGKGQRTSTASSQLIRSNSNNSFACTESDTLTRSHQHIDRRGLQDSSSPYATFQLASKVLENLSHHGALPPPPPPRRFENFSNEGSLDLNNRFIAHNMHRNMIPGLNNMETTFMFPNTNVNQPGPSSNNFPVKYPSEALKMKLN